MRIVVTTAIALLASGCSLTTGDRGGRDVRSPVTDWEIDRLIAAMRREDDAAHGDYSSSVFRLIEVGRPAVPKLVSLLMDDATNERTSERAQNALNGIVLEQFGFRFGQGWGKAARQDAAHQQLTALGRLDRGVLADERRAAAQRWRDWADNPPIKHAEPSAAADPGRM